MIGREKIIDVEASLPFEDISGLTGYAALKVLIRWHGTPIGFTRISLSGDCCTAMVLRKAILDEHSDALIRQIVRNWLSTPAPRERLPAENLLNVKPPAYDGPWPLVTVVVCTRNRTADLSLCLDSLNKLDYPELEILVVDNAANTDDTKHLVRKSYPRFRYVCEPRPGLDWARNRGIIEACGEIIAFTDDDVVVDVDWLRALVSTFTDNPEVMAVTGLVVPYKLETEAQVLFELFGGFGRGFERRWIRTDRQDKWRWSYFGTGQFGTGANMAYRHKLFNEIGLFDPALDVGTVTNGGGDLEMFFRVLNAGHILAYEPCAIVRHHHRRKYFMLRAQLKNNGIGLVSYIMRSIRAYPRQRIALMRLGLWWFWKGNMRPLLTSLLKPSDALKILYLDQLRGSFIGFGRYAKAYRRAMKIEKIHGPMPARTVSSRQPLKKANFKSQDAYAIRSVDLSQKLGGLNDVSDYSWVRVFVNDGVHSLGSLNIYNYHQPISVTRLREAIADHFGVRLLDPDRSTSKVFIWSKIAAALTDRLIPHETNQAAGLSRFPDNITVSVVVATLDRPNDLRSCLKDLKAQKSAREVEIIVVDNNPSSGTTPTVIAEFEDIVLVNERRKGLAYARNAGFNASKGAIVIATDDDVKVPEDWLEKLIAPFIRPEVMIVTGNVLPLEIENTAQNWFEIYGGLGRGFEPFEVGSDWFNSHRGRAVPTWELGATANTALRASIFSHSRIGLMDEALGPGMPSGVGEDTYLFYKVLKNGYTLVYNPAAFLWHKHRYSKKALRRQLYNYSKGHVAYHLTTLLRDRDLRALSQIVLHLPKWRVKQFYQYFKSILFRRERYPLQLILVEIAGNLAGPWCLWKSRRRVKREGRSNPYIPVSQRTNSSNNQTSVDAKDISDTAN
jgi:glycosyltransferase involved in cell wall biosynthesis